jgi:hypothetical protein
MTEQPKGAREWWIAKSEGYDSYYEDVEGPDTGVCDDGVNRVHVIEYAAYESLQRELAEREAEVEEQCRLNGMGQERELKLITERDHALTECARLRETLECWVDEHGDLHEYARQTLKERGE